MSVDDVKWRESHEIDLLAVTIAGKWVERLNVVGKWSTYVWSFPRRADSNRPLLARKQARMTVETLRDGS